MTVIKAREKPVFEEAENSENEALGQQIRARRLQLRMGQREVARATGLSATFISNLERGQANPTLDTLRRVADALNTPLFRLLADSADTNPVVRRQQRKHMRFPIGRLDIEVLTPDLLHKMVVFQVRASAADGNLVVGPLLTPTEECFVILQGSIAMTVAGQVHELHCSDSIYIEGRSLQGIRVISEEEAVYIVAMTPPAF